MAPTSPASSSSSDPPDRSSPFRTFEEDVGGGRAIAGLRLAGAAALLAGGAWLVISTPTPRALGMALISVLVAGAWIAGFVRSRRRGRERLLLRLTPVAIEIVLGDRLERARWSEVRDVAVDEDRLVVRVDRRDGAPLVIEPLWRGVGAYALSDAIRAAWRRASSAPEPSDPTEHGAGRSEGSDP